MKAIQLLILICSTAFSLTYQENVINVQGTAKRDVLPNKAEFTIIVKATHTEKDSAIARLNPRIEKLGAIFEKFSLDSTEAKLKGFSILPITEFKNGERVKLGYTASKSFDITTTTLSDLSALLGDFYVEARASFEHISFTRTDRDSLEKELLREAIKDAKVNATILAEESSVELITATFISNQKPELFRYENRVDVNMTDFGKGTPDLLGSIMGGGGSNVNLTPSLFKIEPPIITLNNSVWVTYKIRAKK